MTAMYNNRNLVTVVSNKENSCLLRDPHLRAQQSMTYTWQNHIHRHRLHPLRRHIIHGMVKQLKVLMPPSLHKLVSTLDRQL
jgi:hypothetical protein